MAESELHLLLVRRLVNHARAHGVEVEYAAIPGLDEPYAINGYRPDMIGWFEDRPIIGEAETGASLVSTHTLAQLRAFSHAHGSGGDAKISLAVPRPWQARARGVAAAAGITASRLVLVPSPRLRARALPPTFPQLQLRGQTRPVAPRVMPFERGRRRTVAPPGTVFQRGRRRTIR